METSDSTSSSDDKLVNESAIPSNGNGTSSAQRKKSLNAGAAEFVPSPILVSHSLSTVTTTTATSVGPHVAVSSVNHSSVLQRASNGELSILDVTGTVSFSAVPDNADDSDDDDNIDQIIDEDDEEDCEEPEFLHGKQYRDITHLTKDIKRQCEYYFSNQNLWKDAFLLNLMNSNPDKYVPVAVLASFKKVLQMTHDISLVVCALKQSDKLQLNEDNTAVRRIHPLPPYDQYKDANRTLYVEHLPDGSTVKSVKKLFSRFGKVTYVLRPEEMANITSDHPIIPDYPADSTPESDLTSAFVQFEKPAFCKKALTHIIAFNKDVVAVKKEQRLEAKRSRSNSVSSTPGTPKVLPITSQTPQLSSRSTQLKAGTPLSNLGTPILTALRGANVLHSPPFGAANGPIPAFRDLGSPALNAKNTSSPRLSALSPDFVPSPPANSLSPPPLELSPTANSRTPSFASPVLSAVNLSASNTPGSSPLMLALPAPGSVILPEQFVGMFVMPKMQYLKKQKVTSSPQKKGHKGPVKKVAEKEQNNWRLNDDSNALLHAVAAARAVTLSPSAKPFVPREQSPEHGMSALSLNDSHPHVNRSPALKPRNNGSPALKSRGLGSPALKPSSRSAHNSPSLGPINPEGNKKKKKAGASSRKSGAEQDLSADYDAHDASVIAQQQAAAAKITDDPNRPRFSLTRRGSNVSAQVNSRFAQGPINDTAKGFARGRGKPIAATSPTM